MPKLLSASAFVIALLLVPKVTRADDVPPTIDGILTSPCAGFRQVPYISAALTIMGFMDGMNVASPLPDSGSTISGLRTGDIMAAIGAVCASNPKTPIGAAAIQVWRSAYELEHHVHLQ